MRTLPFCSFFILTLAYLSETHAAERVKAQERAAKKACAAGDFRTGVEILAGLYVDTDNATYIFNQGRCYEQNHQWVNATDRFREYLRKDESLSPEVKADVERHIADCEALQKRQEFRVEPSPAVPMVAAAPPLAPEPAQQAKVASPAPAPRQENQGSGVRVAGIVLGSIGTAALATGLILNLKANSLASDFNKTHNSSTQSSQSSYKTGSMLGYGVGAGLLATGVLLYFLGRPTADSKPSQISLLPGVMPAEFSLSIKRTFQ